MSGAAARTGKLDKNNNRKLIKKGIVGIVENNKTKGQEVCTECNYR